MTARSRFSIPPPSPPPPPLPYLPVMAVSPRQAIARRRGGDLAAAGSKEVKR
jgi:hypothetical protein